MIQKVMPIELLIGKGSIKLPVVLRKMADNGENSELHMKSKAFYHCVFEAVFLSTWYIIFELLFKKELGGLLLVGLLQQNKTKHCISLLAI